MKKNLLFLLAAFSMLFVACENNLAPDDMAGKEIKFGVKSDGINMSVSTKATAVTSVSTVYWEAKEGSTVKYAKQTCSVSGGTVTTGQYWPATIPSGGYIYFVSNHDFASGTGVMSVNNTEDVVAGTTSGARSNGVTVALDHIFSRTGTLTFVAKDGYTASNVVWKIASTGSAAGTAGSYTIGTGWASSGATALAKQEFTSSSDLYLIPGSYSVEVSFTLTKGSFTQNYVKTGSVTLVQGKVNNITADFDTVNPIDDASDIEFGVTVTPWGSEDHTPNFS